jgi:hypothetical protein
MFVVDENEHAHERDAANLTDSNPFEYTTGTLSPELHEQSLFTFLFILKCESLPLH